MGEPINQMEPWFDEKEATACAEYMRSGGWLMEFKKTREFEQMICDYTGAKYCHIVNNGTISLSIALLALDVGPGDHVLVPNMTMIATANAVRLLGAVPVFVDVDERTLCIGVNGVREALAGDARRAIKAVMHVSMNARCNDIRELGRLCEARGLPLVEDSAQSLGSFRNGRHLGTFGCIGSFSFSAPKIVSTGQGGALITNNKRLSQRIWKIKNFGRAGGGNDFHNEFGINSKTTDLQSVVGIEQMKKLPWRVCRMKEIWKRYYDRLSPCAEITMLEPTDSGWRPWFVDIYVDDRNSLREHLQTKGIGSRPVYPPVSSQPVYKEWNDKSFPVTEKFSSRGLWLPSSSKLTDEEVNRVCGIVLEWAGS
jgi:perosamine synthetase